MPTNCTTPLPHLRSNRLASKSYKVVSFTTQAALRLLRAQAAPEKAPGLSPIVRTARFVQPGDTLPDIDHYMPLPSFDENGDRIQTVWKGPTKEELLAQLRETEAQRRSKMCTEAKDSTCFPSICQRRNDISHRTATGASALAATADASAAANGAVGGASAAGGGSGGGSLGGSASRIPSASPFCCRFSSRDIIHPQPIGEGQALPSVRAVRNAQDQASCQQTCRCVDSTVQHTEVCVHQDQHPRQNAAQQQVAAHAKQEPEHYVPQLSEAQKRRARQILEQHASHHPDDLCVNALPPQSSIGSRCSVVNTRSSTQRLQDLFKVARRVDPRLEIDLRQMAKGLKDSTDYSVTHMKLQHHLMQICGCDKVLQGNPNVSMVM